MNNDRRIYHDAIKDIELAWNEINVQNEPETHKNDGQFAFPVKLVYISIRNSLPWENQKKNNLFCKNVDPCRP